MTVSGTDEISRILREKKHVLFFAGSLCDEMELDGKKLSDYVVELSTRLNSPVAASGNVVNSLRNKGAAVTKKAALQLVEMTRYEGWRDPIMPDRPGLLVFIGFPAGVARALVSAAHGVDTLVLGTTVVDEATYSLADSSQMRLKEAFESVVAAL